MSVEMNELSVGACLFGTVIWADCFGKIVHSDVVMEVVVEVEAVDVVPAQLFLSFSGMVVWEIWWVRE